MTDKFNAFAKAQKEVAHEEKPKKSSNKPVRKKRETKEQMSLMFTPSHKEKARKIADRYGISVSELFAEWLDEKE